jgi:hypothetical protein
VLARVRLWRPISAAAARLGVISAAEYVTAQRVGQQLQAALPTGAGPTGRQAPGVQLPAGVLAVLELQVGRGGGRRAGGWVGGMLGIGKWQEGRMLS